MVSCENILNWLKFSRNEHDNMINRLLLLLRLFKVKGQLEIFKCYTFWLYFDRNDHDNIILSRSSKVKGPLCGGSPGVEATYNEFCSENCVILVVFNSGYLTLIVFAESYVHRYHMWA